MKTTFPRRSFLSRFIAAPACAVVTKVSSAETETPDRNESRLPAKIKLSLNAWSYNRPLFRHLKGEPDGISLFELLDECARLEFEAIDPTAYFFPNYPELPDRSFVNELKRRAFRLGLDISGTGIRNDFATANASKRKADVELAKRWIDVSAEMGAPVLRVFGEFVPKGDRWDEAAKRVADSLAACAEHGQRHGVMIGIQNHAHMLSSADEVLKLLSMVDSDWVGTIVDTGSFLTEDPYDDITRVIPHAVSWQVKNLLRERRGGPIDIDRLVKILRTSNYRGYVPLETVPEWGREEDYDAAVEVPALLVRFRKALETAH